MLRKADGCRYPSAVQQSWDPKRNRLTLRLTGAADVARLREEIVSQSGLMVRLPEELALFTKIIIDIRSEDFVRLELQSEVAQVFLLPDGTWNTALLAQSVPELTSPELETREETETSGVAPIYRIQQMNPNEKARLATRAGKQERQVLLRDSSPMVLQSLLANPRIEARDVVRIVKSTHVNGGLLKRIAEDGRWGKNQEILANIAKNPKTPPPLTARLMDRLRTSDLRFMGKMSSGLREDVRRAALREYLRRSGQ